MRTTRPISPALATLSAVLLAWSCAHCPKNGGTPDASVPDETDGGFSTDLDAPPLDRTVATSIAEATRFLYTGPNAVQKDVAPGVIDPLRVAVLRGRVINLAGQPFAGVEVRALGHGELGRTTTRADGRYDFALNGGGPSVLEFAAAGYLRVSRRMETPWQDYVVVPDVALTPLDTASTSVNPKSTAPQVARGSTSNDPQGARRPTLIFKPGTTATMTLAGGVSAPLPPPWTVRITEYTVGDTGRAAMPALLPPTSGYTFAAELSIDEAQAAGASRVEFSQPVALYVENFIGMRVGATMPAGSLDRTTGRWVSEPDGRVLKILSIAGDVAALDADGDGGADPDAALAALGIDVGERTRLAELYPAGQALWRVPTLHFSAIDHNSPYGPPEGAQPPPPSSPAIHNPCSSHRRSSIVACEDQVLKEAAAIKGTAYQLRYSSERVPGRGAEALLDVRVTGPVVPPGLKGIVVQASIAGRLFEKYYEKNGAADPIAPNLSWTIPWDGMDTYGRLVQGTVPILVRTNFVYPAIRYETNTRAYRAFGGYSDIGSPFPVLNGCVTLSINGISSNPYASPFCGFNFTRDERRGAGVWDAREAGGLGGWTLDVHHSYDPNDRSVRLGNGTTERANTSASVVQRVAGGGTALFPAAHGGPAKSADLDQVEDVAVAPDGTIYGVTRRANPPGGLRRIERDGRIYEVARLPGLPVPTGLAIDENERVYVSGRDAQSNGRVVRVDPDGTVTPIAGRAWQGGPTPTPATLGDGAAATDAALLWPTDVAIGPDGALYITDMGLPGSPQLARVRRVELESGIIDTMAGGGTDASSIEDLGAGEPALQHSLYGVSAISFDRKGQMYLALGPANTVVRVGIDGILTRFAGTGAAGSPNQGFPPLDSPLNMPNDLAVGLDDTVYVRTRHSGPSASNLILAIRDGRTEIVGGYVGLFASNISDGAPATGASIPGDHGLGLAPDGSLYVRTRFVIYRIGPRFSGFGEREQIATSLNGQEAWVFDAQGRHLRTIDSLTGVTVHRFTYDASGRLSGVIDRDGRATTIERSGDGRPTAIVAPGGARTELVLNADGYLATLRDPAGAETHLSYGPGGLLTELVDRRGGKHAFAYDGEGRLTSAHGPAGHALALTREEQLDEVKVTVTNGAGRAEIFRTRRLQSGDIEQTMTDAAGAVSAYRRQPDGTEIVTRPDGQQVTTRFGADPRLGLAAPRVTERETKSPAGRTSLLKIQRSAALTDPADPFSFTQLSDTFNLDGRSTTVVYSKAQRSTLVVTAGGRRRTLVEDAAGRESLVTEGAGGTPVTKVYDALGRLTRIARGGAAMTVVYDDRDRPVTITDPTSRSTQFAYDGADRLVTVTDAMGGAHGTAYDGEGDVIGFSQPSGAQHAKVLDGFGELSRYQAPGAAAPWTFERDADSLTSALDFGAGRALTVTRDAGGRLTHLTGAGEELRYAYADATERPADLLIDRPGAAQDQRLELTFDGDAVTRIAFTGAAAGEFTLAYDGRGNLVSRRLRTGADNHTTAFAYDLDDLRTQEGPFTFTRGGARGEVTRIEDAALRIDTIFDAVGRPATRTLTVGGAAVYREQLTFDDADRVTRRIETFGAAASQLDYSYDLAGRLTAVHRDGAASESSAYDADGNRISRSRPGLTETMTYDAQGRLAQRGAIVYAFDAGGILSARGGDVFTFGPLRHLQRAVVGTTTIDYAFDALGRRCARTVAGQTEQFFYADPHNPWLLTASRAPDGQLSLYFHDPEGRLIAVQRGANRFYVATDLAGTPRIVTDATGAVVKRLDYDAYGDLISDSAPSFALPIGYAGGLRDPSTGLVTFGFREYEAAAGRFTARDPVLELGGQSNLYAYVDGDPVNRTDPSGLDPANLIPSNLPSPREDLFPKKPSEFAPKEKDPNPAACQDSTANRLNRFISDPPSFRWAFEKGLRRAWDFATTQDKTPPTPFMQNIAIERSNPIYKSTSASIPGTF
ncbi:hypothetical protein JY651_13655 [Pyxidicoccus parkwayensis]|uniref:Uncharacterized protein n=1 Tax=Pyxidicoccus parkwayensis TaxID=2813578 RepID=A0ABX7P651_9BACT|nr:RHS repeat-associated core domain-containing protein [Pyxidicoccus parkwaysis]QSQ25905.1 hypothetical protein JY651_13655 [Pyxidicoccus parkwaysis]